MKKLSTIALLAFLFLFVGTARADGVPSGYILDPADGSTIASLSTVNLSYEGSVSLALSTYNVKSPVTDASGTQVATVSWDESYNESTYVTSVVGTLSETITAPGTYTIAFQEKLFIDYSSYDPSPAFTATYTIEGDSGAGGDTGVTFEITTIDEDEIEVETWAEDYEIVIKSNTYGYLYYTIDNTTTGENEYSGYIGYPTEEEGSSDTYTYTWTAPVECKFYEDNTYAFNVSLCESDQYGSAEIGNATLLTITGKAENDKSDITLIDPEDEEIEDYAVDNGDDFTATWEFSGKVKIDSEESYITIGRNSDRTPITQALDKIEAVDADADGYSAQWTLTVGWDTVNKYFLSEGMRISAYVSDEDGNAAYYLRTYYLDINNADPDLSEYTFTPEDGATVERIETIKVENTAGIGISYNGEITITNAAGETVAKITGDDCEAGDYGSEEAPDDSDNKADEGGSLDWGDSYSVTVKLPEAITEAGVYTVNVPKGFFTIGSQESSTGNAKFTLTYTVGAESSTGTVTSDGIEITPSAGVVESLSQIRFAHDPISVTWTYNESYVQILDADNEIVAQGYTDGYDEEFEGWDPDYAITFYLDKTVTEPGTYTLSVPAGYFYLDSSYSTESAAISVEYIIEGEVAVEPTIELVSPELDENGSVSADKWLGEGSVEDGEEYYTVIATSNVAGGEMTCTIVDITEGLNDDEKDNEHDGGTFAYDETNDQYTWSPYFTQTFYAGHTYAFNVSLKESSDDSDYLIESYTLFTIEGATETSNVSEIGIDEDATVTEDIEIESGEDAVFTIVFTGAVDISESTATGDGSTLDVTVKGVEGTESEDAEGYYTEWEITVSADVIAELTEGRISVCIIGEDSEGKTLFGEGDAAYKIITFYYTVTGAEEPEVATFDLTTTPAANATLTEALSSIEIYAPEGVDDFAMADGADVTEIYITCDEEEVAYCFNTYTEITDEDGNVIGYSIELSSSVSTDGSYVLNIPSGLFSGAVDGEDAVNAEATIDFSIAITTGISAINAAIADGGEVYNLAGQKVNAPVKGNVYIIKSAGSVKKMLVK